MSIQSHFSLIFFISMLQIGVEYGLKPAQVKGRDIQIEIWDTAGYYRNADGCLVCFDLTNRSSFDSVSKWVEHARSNSGNPLLVFTLVGNKADRQEGREVARAEAEALAAHHGMEYREITAKDNEAVQGLFHTTAERIFKAVESGPDGEAGAVGSDIVIDGAGRVRLRSTSSSSASSSTGNIVLAPGKASKNSSSAAEGGCC
eukprot:evm.model.NODE_17322_length_11106_cov_35.773457.2